MLNLTQLTSKLEELEKRIKSLTNNVSVSDCKLVLADIKEILKQFKDDYTLFCQDNTADHLSFDARLDALEEEILGLDATATQVDLQNVISDLNELTQHFNLLSSNASNKFNQIDGQLIMFENNISNLQSTTQTNTQNISTNTTNIATNTTNIATLQDDIDDLGDRVTTLEENSSSGANIDSEELEELQSQVNTNTANIGSHTTQINNLQTSQTSNNSTITNLSTRLTTAETNISALSNGTINTDGKDYLESFNTFDYYRIAVNKTIPTSTEILFPSVKFCYDADSLVKVQIVINYLATPANNAALIRARFYVNNINVDEYCDIDPKYFKNQYILNYVIDAKDKNDIALKLEVSNGSMHLKNIEFFIMGKQVEIKSGLLGVECNILDGVTYYTSSSVTDIVQLRAQTTNSAVPVATINTQQYKSSLYYFVPKLVWENGLISKLGHYFLCYGNKVLIILELNENYEIVNTYSTNISDNYNHMIKPSIYSGSCDILVYFINCDGIIFYSTIENLKTSSTLMQLKINSSNNNNKYYGISPIVNKNQVTGTSENKNYGYVATKYDGYVYFYDGINSNCEIQIAKGLRPRGFVQPDGSILIYLSTKNKQMKKYKFNYNYTDFSYTLKLLHSYENATYCEVSETSWSSRITISHKGFGIASGA